MEYPKIETLFARDPETHRVLLDKVRLPEFTYLWDNEWHFTEKVDGTNIRVIWENGVLRFGGKTDAAQIPPFLLSRLQQLFTSEQFVVLFPPEQYPSLVLYGEGYGAKIQKGGGNYKPDGVDFVLFDVLIGRWWLERENIVDIASKLGILVVPIVGSGTLGKAVALVQCGFKSTWGDFPAEGLVLRPTITLFTRKGERIIAKLKARDFKGGKGE